MERFPGFWQKCTGGVVKCFQRFLRKIRGKTLFQIEETIFPSLLDIEPKRFSLLVNFWNFGKRSLARLSKKISTSLKEHLEEKKVEKNCFYSFLNFEQKNFQSFGNKTSPALSRMHSTYPQKQFERATNFLKKNFCFLTLPDILDYIISFMFGHWAKNCLHSVWTFLIGLSEKPRRDQMNFLIRYCF